MSGEHPEYNRDTNPYPSFGKKYNGEKAIISMTSWAARIATCPKTIFSLLKQCPGFHIVLVLSEEEFPKMTTELPENLMLFVDNELIELMFVRKNYKSFKKVIFSMDKYRDVPVISADDDCVYVCNYAQKLYNKWMENKNCVITNDGKCKKEIEWCRGPNTLYPPNILPNPSKICEMYFNLDLNIIEDDLFIGCMLQKYKIKIIDLHQPTYYVFHDEINAQSKNINWTAKTYQTLYKTFICILNKYEQNVK